jgi:hypothetical protein
LTTGLTSGANPMPPSALSILGIVPPAGSTIGGGAMPNVGSPVAVFSNGPSSGTAEFGYSLRLAVPATQAAGAYTGGQLTFTATA